MGTQRYITILEWQLQLGLKGNELIALALIWGFNQSGQKYTGTSSYLAFWLGISKRNALAVLQRLVKKGILIKEERVKNGVKFCSYSVNVEFCNNLLLSTNITSGDETSPGGGDETSWGGDETSPGGDETSPNNTNNIDININTLSNKKGAAKFQKPSLEEIEEYCRQRQNSVDAVTFFNHYESNGWMVGKTHMKDWKAAIRTWERRQEKEGNRRQSAPSQRRDKFSEMVGVAQRMFSQNREVVDEQ